MVSLTVAQQGNFHEFIMWNNGNSIDPMRFNDAFKVFNRLDRKIGPEGTGMGLAIARRVIENHGGAIWFAPVAEGSELHFTLPAG